MRRIFIRPNEDGSVVYFAHCISRTGSYLSAQAGVKEGTAMAYLIAPPLEAAVGLDAALKAAKNGDVSESAVDSFILEVGEAK